MLENNGKGLSVNKPLVCAGCEAGAGVGGGDAGVITRRPDWDDGDVEVSFFLLDVQHQVLDVWLARTCLKETYAGLIVCLPID